MYNFLRDTDLSLSARDSIAIIAFIEQEVIKLAKEKGFKGLFGTKTSPISQQLSTIFLGYETMSSFKINQYVDSEGNRQFKSAPDHYVATVMYKHLK
jgi:hypothetical protein